LLPCETCKRDYSQYVKTVPVEANKAFQWTVDLHNWVNKKVGKGLQISYEEAYANWTSNKCSYKCAVRGVAANTLGARLNQPKEVASPQKPEGQTVLYLFIVGALVLVAMFVYALRSQ
jgi:hypothetical protein